MTQKSATRRVTSTLADLTGTTDEELRLTLTVAAAGAGVFAALRIVKLLGDLGSDVLARPRKSISHHADQDPALLR